MVILIFLNDTHHLLLINTLLWHCDLRLFHQHCPSFFLRLLMKYSVRAVSSKAPLWGTLLRTFFPADVASYRCQLLFHQLSPHFTVLYLIHIFHSSNNELSCGIIPKSRPTADLCVESHCMRERCQVHLARLLQIWMLLNPFSIYVPFFSMILSMQFILLPDTLSLGGKQIAVAFITLLFSLECRYCILLFLPAWLIYKAPLLCPCSFKC